MSRRHAATLLVALCASCAASTGATSSFPTAMPALRPARPTAIPRATLFALRNGRSALVVEDHTLPVVCVRIVWPSGAGDEDFENAGVGSLALDAVASPDSGEAGERRTALDDLGARVETNTAWDYSDIGVLTLPRNVEPSMELLTSLITREHLSNADVVRVQKEHIHTIEQCHDSASCVAWNRIHATVLGNTTRRAFDPIGRIESLRALSAGQADAWRRQHFSLSDAHFVVVGDVDPSEIVRYLDRVTGPVRSRDVPTRARRPLRAPSRAQVDVVARVGSAQSEVRIGHVCGGLEAPDYAAVQVMRQVIGGNFLSRLNQNLRERHGYTYGAGVVIPSPLGGDVAMAAFGSQNRTVGLAIDETMHELSRLSWDAIGDAELQGARDRARTDVIRRFGTPYSTAKSFAQLVGMDLSPDFFQQLLETLGRVDAEDVRRAARACLTPNELTIVVVGDEEQIRRNPGKALLQHQAHRSTW